MNNYEDMTITTGQGLKIIKLLNDMKVKDPLLELIDTIDRLEGEKKVVLKQLFDVLDEGTEITEEVTQELFSNNIELAKAYSDINSNIQKQTMDFILDFIFGLGDNSKNFYNTLGAIYNKKPKEIEEQEIGETVEQVVAIFKSSSFMGFFKSMKR